LPNSSRAIWELARILNIRIARQPFTIRFFVEYTERHQQNMPLTVGEYLGSCKILALQPRSAVIWISFMPGIGR
jgi:hypothetical protein